MSKQYVTPTTNTVNIGVQPILTGSTITGTGSTITRTCSNTCKYWHFCRDRDTAFFCKDKKYKNEK